VLTDVGECTKWMDRPRGSARRYAAEHGIGQAGGRHGMAHASEKIIIRLGNMAKAQTDY